MIFELINLIRKMISLGLVDELLIIEDARVAKISWQLSRFEFVLLR